MVGRKAAVKLGRNDFPRRRQDLNLRGRADRQDLPSRRKT
jgi:hypothetical protein